MPLAGAGVQQVTDVAPKKVDPRLTDSQKFVRDEQEKLLEAVREAKERKKKAEEKDKQDKLPAFELADRQSAADLMLSPDDTHVFILVAERPVGARSIIVPNYVTETGYSEDIPGRTAVGDAQSRTLLAILNLKTGKTAWADASFAPPADEPVLSKVEGRHRRRSWNRTRPGPRTRRPRKPTARSAGRCPWCPMTAGSPSRPRGRPTTRTAGS